MLGTLNIINRDRLTETAQHYDTHRPRMNWDPLLYLTPGRTAPPEPATLISSRTCRSITPRPTYHTQLLRSATPPAVEQLYAGAYDLSYRV